MPVPSLAEGVAPNAYRGEGCFTVDGRPYLVAFTWARLAQLKGALGEDYRVQLSRAATAADLDVLATALSIGTGGDLTVAEVQGASPPVFDVITAVLEAISRAYYGTVNPPEPGKKKAGK